MCSLAPPTPSIPALCELLPGFRFDLPDRLEAVTCQASDDTDNHSESQFSVVVQQGPTPDPPTLTKHVPPLTNKTSANFEFSA